MGEPKRAVSFDAGIPLYLRCLSSFERFFLVLLVPPVPCLARTVRIVSGVLTGRGRILRGDPRLEGFHKIQNHFNDRLIADRGI
jgi:hypothetical protein